MVNNYPFEDFQRHFQDVSHRNFVRDGRDFSFEINVLKTRDYLSEFYDGDDLVRNLTLFISMYRHITANAAAYDTGLLGIRDDDGIHASDALQFAVHWYHTTHPISEWYAPDAVAKIKNKASEWNDRKNG